MLLEAEVVDKVYRDYLFVRTKIDRFLLYERKRNRIVIEQNYINPKTEAVHPALHIRDNNGEYIYYFKLRNALENILLEGYAKKSIKKFSPPEYIIKLIK